MGAEGGLDRGVLLAATSLFVALNAPMLRFDRIMRAANGHGIVALELAGSAAAAQTLLDGWGPAGRRAARRSLLLDFPYTASYTASLVSGLRCTAAGAGSCGRGRWTRALVPATVIAGGCDAIEGLALLAFLRTGAPSAPAVARAAASVKFALLGIALATVVSSPGQLWRGLAR